MVRRLEVVGKEVLEVLHDNNYEAAAYYLSLAGKELLELRQRLISSRPEDFPFHKRHELEGEAPTVRLRSLMDV